MNGARPDTVIDSSPSEIMNQFNAKLLPLTTLGEYYYWMSWKRGIR